MPEDRKDGRTVLLWGDAGAARDCWTVNPPGREKGWSGWEEPEEWHAIEGVTHWVDINPPN